MKNILLASASAVALVSVSTGAFAQVPVYGGGSTFAAKVDRDVFNCLTGVPGHPASDGGALLSGDTSPVSETIPTSPATTDATSYPTVQNSACGSDAGLASTTVSNAYYAPTGSGAALTAFTLAGSFNLAKIATNNPVPWELGTDPQFGANNANGYPEFDFAASDAPVNSIITTTLPPYTLPATYGVTLQVPVAGLGVGIVVKVTSQSTGHALDVNLKTTTQLCEIWNGTINNWSDTHLKNAFTDSVTRQVVAIGPSEPIYLTARHDGSGTTYLFTNFLANTCGASRGFKVAQNAFPSTSQSTWTANPGTAVATIVGSPMQSAALAPKIYEATATEGSSGEANSVLSQEGAIGYVGTDYVNNVPNPNIALVNGLFPNSTNVAAALSAVAVPAGYTGQYTTVSGTKVSINKTTGLNAWNTDLAGKATGHITVKTGYPIAGFTFIDVYSCSTATTGTPGAQALVQQYYSDFTSDAGSYASPIGQIYQAANFVEPTGHVLTGIGTILGNIGTCTNNGHG